MAHFASCLDNGIAPSPDTPAPSKASMQPRQEQQRNVLNDQMIWQQKEDVGACKPKRRNRARKVPNFVPLDTGITAAQAPPAVGQSSFDRQKKLRATIFQPEAPGQARTCVTPQHSKQPAPPKRLLPQDYVYAVAKKPRSNRKNRKNRKPNGEYQSADMSPTPARAYIPPHLRKNYPALLSEPNIGPTVVTSLKQEAPLSVKQAVVSQQCGYRVPRREGINLAQAEVSRNDSPVSRQEWPSSNVSCTGLSEKVNPRFVGGVDPPASIKSQISKPAQGQVSACEINQKIGTTPSPPTTEEPPKATALVACNDPQLKESHSPPRRENHKWSRTQKPPKGKHMWLKTRDIPKALSSGSQSDGGVNFKSDSDGDPSYDVKKLMDWSGDWLPAPEDWAARRGFTSRHFGQVIELWANEHSKDCTKPMDITLPDFLGLQGEDGKWMNKDLVPRYWLHETIDGAPPRKFWEEMRHRAPAPLSGIDITENLPYWERWSA